MCKLCAACSICAVFQYGINNLLSSGASFTLAFLPLPLTLAKTVTTLKIKLPTSGETLTKTMILTKKHKIIEKLFEKKFWENG